MISICKDFKEIEKDWKRIYDLTTNSVFQSYEYNKISWETFHNRENLYLIVYKDCDGKVRIIIPTSIDAKGTVKFINQSGTDICDIIYEPDLILYDPLKEVSDFLYAQKEIKYISLENILATSPLLTYLKIFQSRSIVYSNNEVTYINCTKSEDPISSFKHLTSDRRKKLKKIVKQSDSYNFKIFSREKGDEFPESALIEIAQAMVKNGIRSNSTFDSSFWKYTKCTFENKILEIGILYDSKNIPLSAGFVFANRFISVRWVILYKETKFNLWNNVLYINSKAQDNSYQNNFGRGGYDYKMGNFKPDIDLLYKLMIPKNNTSTIAAYIAISLFFIKRMINTLKIYRLLSNIKISISNIKSKLWH